VFKRDSLPRFTKQTADAFALTKTRLHPHSNGALTSLVFNRGPSLANTDQRKEMRWIKHNISIKREDRVPSDIRSMKRLWSYTKLKGLHLRRDAEAKLFQEGLDSKR
jgi:GH24 family phage-related lysozyme (muramidase)